MFFNIPINIEIKGGIKNENMEISIRNFIYYSCDICSLSINICWINTLEENGEVGGSAGLIVAIFMLAGGIVSIAVRNSEKKGGNIALIVLFILAALLGFMLAGSYADLYIWSAWCLLNGMLAVISLMKIKKVS